MTTEAKVVATDHAQPAVVVEAPKEQEFVSAEDKVLLDAVKHQESIAVARAETAVAEARLAESNRRNVILQLALRYKLADGDRIEENGSITRKTK